MNWKEAEKKGSTKLCDFTVKTFMKDYDGRIHTI